MGIINVNFTLLLRSSAVLSINPNDDMLITTDFDSIN